MSRKKPRPKNPAPYIGLGGLIGALAGAGLAAAVDPGRFGFFLGIGLALGVVVGLAVGAGKTE